MKFEKQQEAKKLRAQGKSINSIAKELDVSKSSVSLWTQEIILTDEQIKELKKNRRGGSLEAGKINRSRYLKEREGYQKEGREKAKEKNLLHCIGCMLFWAEGSKNKNQVTFTNTDVNMMKLFVKFLKEICNIKNNQIKLVINCFLKNENEIDRYYNYWVEQLNINGCSIGKPTIKITDQPIDNYGVCVIHVFNTKLAQQLYGAIQEYGGFDNQMCLINKRSRKINK